MLGAWACACARGGVQPGAPARPCASGAVSTLKAWSVGRTDA